MKKKENSQCEKDFEKAERSWLIWMVIISILFLAYLLFVASHAHDLYY